MSANNVNKRKKKEYYLKCSKKFKTNHLKLESGMRGFLVTCNNREKEAVREAYNLLNEYAEKIWGPENPEEANLSCSDEEKEDVASMLKKELSALQSTSKSSERRFQQVQSGANNVIFIRTSVDDPLQLIHSILTHAYDSSQALARHIMRIQPILGTCKVHELETIVALGKKVIEPYFNVPTSPSYSIQFKARNNAKISKKEVQIGLGAVISEMNYNSRVEFDAPDLVIGIDIIRNICCISVQKDFFKYRKYNLQEVATARTNTSQKNDSKEVTNVCAALPQENQESIKQENQESIKQENLESIKQENLESIKQENLDTEDPPKQLVSSD